MCKSETDIEAIKSARAVMQYCENMKIAKIAHLWFTGENMIAAE